MDYSILLENIGRNNWGLHDFRSMEYSLMMDTQKALESFAPLSSESYKDNPIQVLDFFSGAGGTSLGFAALNTVLPIFKLLGSSVIYGYGIPAY